MLKGGLIRPQLARLGKIVIGEKGEVRTSTKGTQFQPPMKLDHFVIKSLYRDDAGRLVEEKVLMTRLGGKPRELKIRLPFNDLEANFLCELRYYRGGTLYCSGDGEQARRRPIMFQKGERPTYGSPAPFGPCGETCPDFQSRNCRRFGALRVILEEQQQVGGIYEFRTTSRTTIENILSGLMTVQAHTGGILGWVPLLMKLVPQTVQTPEGAASKVYVVQIVFDGSPQQLLTTVRDLLALRAPLMQEIARLEADIKALPAHEESPQDARDTQDEFYPEESEAEIMGERGPQRTTLTIPAAEEDPPPSLPVPPPAPSPTPPTRRSRAAIASAAGRLLREKAPGDSPTAKQDRKDLIRACWGVGGWGNVEALPVSKMAEGLAKLEAIKKDAPPPPAADEDDVPDYEVPVAQDSTENAPVPPGETISPPQESAPLPTHDAPTGNVEGSGEVEEPPEFPELLNGHVAPGAVEVLRLWAEMVGEAQTFIDLVKHAPVQDSMTLLDAQEYTMVRNAVRWVLGKRPQAAERQHVLEV